MSSSLTTLRAALLSAIFGLTLAIMVFVPIWFMLSFISRLFTGKIHVVTFILAGAAAAAFLVFVFRMAFEYFRTRPNRHAVSRF